MSVAAEFCGLNGTSPMGREPAAALAEVVELGDVDDPATRSFWVAWPVDARVVLVAAALAGNKELCVLEVGDAVKACAYRPLHGVRWSGEAVLPVGKTES